MLIDAHTHIGSFGFDTRRSNTYVARVFAKLNLSPEDLLKNMDQNGIEMSMVMPQPRPEVRILNVAKKTNDYVAEVVRMFSKRLIGFCITTPFTGEDAGVGELERSIKQLGLQGVKIHECMAMTPLDLDIISPILESVSKLKKPVFIHSGDEGCRAERIGFLAERFPEVTFIMAHMGGPWYGDNAIDVAKYIKNLSLETSAIASPRTIKRAVEEVGYDRVVWGSDVPYQNTSFELAKLKMAGLTKEEFEAVSGKNMAKILRIRHDS